MEKITIVRRRKKVGSTQPESKPEPIQKPPEPQPGQIPLEKDTVDIDIRPSQYQQIKSKIPWERISGGQIEGIGLEIRDAQEGGVLTISFKPLSSLRLLNSAEVCRMLRISRSTLGKWTKSGVINSYKLGRLRRFSREEILDFLCQTA